MERRVFEIDFIEDDNLGGVNAISVVKEPAHQSNFMVFSKETPKEFNLSIDKKQRIVTGAVLIPDIQILRFDENGEYYIYFTKETIKKLSERFFKKSNHKNVTFEHNYEFEGGYLIESWIVNNPYNDKSKELGFKNVRGGTWFASMKIENEDVWQKILKGEVKGFSIEGFLTENSTVKQNVQSAYIKKNNSKMKIKDRIKALVKFFSTETELQAITVTTIMGDTVNLFDNKVEVVNEAGEILGHLEYVMYSGETSGNTSGNTDSTVIEEVPAVIEPISEEVAQSENAVKFEDERVNTLLEKVSDLEKTIGKLSEVLKALEKARPEVVNHSSVKKEFSEVTTNNVEKEITLSEILEKRKKLRTKKN